jgi:hypothetical protein
MAPGPHPTDSPSGYPAGVQVQPPRSESTFLLKQRQGGAVRGLHGAGQAVKKLASGFFALVALGACVETTVVQPAQPIVRPRPVPKNLPQWAVVLVPTGALRLQHPTTLPSAPRNREDIEKCVRHPGSLSQLVEAGRAQHVLACRRDSLPNVVRDTEPHHVATPAELADFSRPRHPLPSPRRQSGRNFACPTSHRRCHAFNGDTKRGECLPDRSADCHALLHKETVPTSLQAKPVGLTAESHGLWQRLASFKPRPKGVFHLGEIAKPAAHLDVVEELRCVGMCAPRHNLSSEEGRQSGQQNRSHHDGSPESGADHVVHPVAPPSGFKVGDVARPFSGAGKLSGGDHLSEFPSHLGKPRQVPNVLSGLLHAFSEKSTRRAPSDAELDFRPAHGAQLCVGDLGLLEPTKGFGRDRKTSRGPYGRKAQPRKMLRDFTKAQRRGGFDCGRGGDHARYFTTPALLRGGELSADPNDPPALFCPEIEQGHGLLTKKRFAPYHHAASADARGEVWQVPDAFPSHVRGARMQSREKAFSRVTESEVHVSDSTAVPRIGAAFWLLQSGKGDQGPSYDLLTLKSPRRPGKYWRLSMLLGSRSGGVSLTTDMWSEETRAGWMTLTIGGAAVTESLGGGEWSPAAVVTLRVSGGGEE